MADRQGTFSLSRVLEKMGVKGGELPQLSGDSIIPVIVTADFSRSQSPEAIEARAFVSFNNQAEDLPGHMHGIYFWSLAPGGCVIERLSATVTQLGDDPAIWTGQVGGVYPAPTVGMPRGQWLVNRVTGTPADPYWTRRRAPTLPPGAPFYPVTPAPSDVSLTFEEMPVPIWRELAKGELGGVQSSSRVYFGLGLSGLNMGRLSGGLEPGAPWGWDPCGVIYSDTTGGSPGFGRGQNDPVGLWDLALPPTFSLQEQVRWYVPSATGVFFSLNTQSAIPPTNVPTYDFQILWREVPQALGGS